MPSLASLEKNTLPTQARRGLSLNELEESAGSFPGLAGIEDQADRIRDARYYQGQFGLDPNDAFDLQPQLNQYAFGREQLPLAPGRMFFDAFMQSLADKPAMILRGTTAYTPGKSLGLDPLLDKASTYIESLKDPATAQRVQMAAQGKLWPVGDERRWWQVEAGYLPEVINAWAANVGDQIPIMLITIAGRKAGDVLGKPIGALAGAGWAMLTGGPGSSDVATAPVVAAITQEVVKHLGAAAPLVAMEAGGFLDETENLKIDRDIAEKYAKLYGVGSGAIEYAQWLWVLGRYGKITQRAQASILKTVLGHIGGSAFEGLEEISQGGLQNRLLQKAVAEMKKRHPKYGGEAPQTWSDAKRDGAIGTGVAFLTGLPGTGMTMAAGVQARRAAVKPETKKFLGEPSTEELRRAAETPAEPGRKIPYEGEKPELRTVDEVAEERGLKDLPIESEAPTVAEFKNAEAEPEPAADLIPEATKMVEAEGKPAAGQTAEEATAAEGKQPWEMTRGEWQGEAEVGTESLSLEFTGSDAVEQAEAWTHSRGFAKGEYSLQTMRHTREGPVVNAILQIMAPGDIGMLQRQMGPLMHHKLFVKRALEQGKPVPRAVLEEYKGEPWADAALATQPAAEGKEGVQKPPMEQAKVIAEGEETPEEAKVARAKLEVEAAEVVKPKLYIGNVTARMKEAVAEATGVKPEEVGPFTEKGWPTKRTAVEMTRGEAEDYLGWLENDLQRRLDNGLIETYEAMWKANADWGDIKALRKALDIPVGTRPWRIIYAQKEGVVLRDQGDIAAANKEIKQLQKEFDRAKTDVEAEEILAEIEAKQLEVHQLNQVAGKAAKIIKTTRESIAGAVEPSRLQESKMTVQEVLRAVMKRSARYAKMAHAQGRRELRADMRAKARAKARLKKAVKTISQKVPKSVDFFYREAIEAFTSNFDLHFRSERTLAHRKALKDFLARIPDEERANIPVAVLEKTAKKPLNEFTIGEVEQVAAEVDKLIHLGKLKRKLAMRPQIEQRKKDIETLTQNVESAKPLKTTAGPKVASTKEGGIKTAFDKAKLWTWTPARLFDMLDGGRGTFAGRWHQVFYDAVKQPKAVARTMIRTVQTEFNNERKRLGFSLLDLVRKRTINVDGANVRMTSQEIMGVYMHSLNERNKLHLIYGNQFTEKGIADVVAAMTTQEKALADWMLDWYDRNQPNLRRAVIEQENRDMGKEEFYSPILTIDTSWKTLQEEMRMAVDQRLQLRSHNVAYGMTLERKDVPEWMRGEVRLDAVNIFNDQVQKQARYIHLGPHVRHMNKVKANHALRKLITDRFGIDMLKTLDGYVAAVANPYIYRQYSLPERISAKLRQNTAIAYLAFNLTTMTKQPFAILFYLPDAGPGHLVASIMDFAAHPIEMIHKVRSLDPEVAELSMEREFEELKQGKNSNVIRKVVTDAGLEGIYFFDQVARTIGWNAVYERAQADGHSEAEAVAMARNATLRTQNAAEAEDIPAIYRSSEFLNWFMIFTNQVNKIYNYATYDVPSYFKNGDYAKGSLGITALALNALIMWMIKNRKWPEDPLELADAISEQSIEMIPMVGKPVLDISEGWGTEVPFLAPLKAPGTVLKAGRRGVQKGEWKLTDSEIREIAEGIAIAAGLPYTGIKRGVQAIEEQQPTALVGARRPSKKKVQPHF